MGIAIPSKKAQEFGEILRLPYFTATANAAGIAVHDGDLPLLFYSALPGAGFLLYANRITAAEICYESLFTPAISANTAHTEAVSCLAYPFSNASS